MNLDHLLVTAGWSNDDRVRCLCGWDCEPGEGALERWFEHVADPQPVLVDAEVSA